MVDKSERLTARLLIVSRDYSILSSASALSIKFVYHTLLPQILVLCRWI